MRACLFFCTMETDIENEAVESQYLQYFQNFPFRPNSHTNKIHEQLSNSTYNDNYTIHYEIMTAVVPFLGESESEREYVCAFIYVFYLLANKPSSLNV